MLAIITTRPSADLLAKPLCAWGAARLIDPVLLLTAGTNEGLEVRLITGGESINTSVVDALDEANLASIVQLTVAIGPEMDDAEELQQIHHLAATLLERAIGPDAWKPPAFVAVPDAPGRHCNPDHLLPELDPWIVVAAEDRPHPGGVNTLLEVDAEHLARHAAHALVCLANAWTFTPPDDESFVTKAREQGAAVRSQFELVRCYSRLIDTGYLADHVAAQVLRPGVRWPNPDVDEFDDIELEDDQSQEIADIFLQVHARTLGLTEVPPLDTDEHELSLWEAIKQVFRYLWDRLRRLPSEWLDRRLGSLYNTIADRVEGMGAKVKVRRWGEREDGETPRSLVEELAAQSLKVEPGAVGPTWEDMWRLSIGLVDGTAIPTSLTLEFLTAGQRRIVETDPRRIVPDPEDRPPAMADRSDGRACDPRRIDPMVLSALAADAAPEQQESVESPLAAWHRPRARSLLWRIGAGIATAWDQADLEREQPSTEEWDMVEERAATVDKKSKKLRRRYFLWLLVRTVLAVAGSFAIVFSDAPLWAQLAGPPAVWLLWLYLLGRGWRRTSTEIKDLQDGAARESEELLQSLFVAIVREADFERLGWRYGEYLDWAEIIGWYLHRPFVGRDAGELAIAKALHPQSLPAAFGAGVGSVSASSFDSLCQASRSQLFRSSWLKTYYEAVRNGLVERWQENHGQDLDQARPTGFADNARGATSLRRFLVAEARKGTGRHLTDNPMSPALLEQLSHRTLTKLVDGVVLVAEEDGQHEWLPPVDAWVSDSTDLAQVAASIQPVVVRVRVTREDGVAGGTGFVLQSTGLVVTNAHVVDGATSVEVAVEGGGWTSALAHAVATDTDLALIKVETGVDLRAATLGTSSDLTIGTRVFTLGFPKLLDGAPTFSSGEVSAARRFVSFGPGQMEVVQGSYAATGGASGSPVFDSSGAVIGVHQGGAEAEDDQRSAAYMSFAVPVDSLRRWLDEIGELTIGTSHPALSTGSPATGAMMAPDAFLDEVAKAPMGTLSREHGDEDTDFKPRSIIQQASSGWQDTAILRFLEPFRTGGSTVEATAPQSAPRNRNDSGDDDAHDGDGGDAGDDGGNDLI